MSQSRSPFNGVNGILGLLIGVFVLYVIFNIVGWIFWLLYKVGVIFFIASLIIDHTVFTGFANSVKGLWQRNWVMGLVLTLLCIALYPLTGLYLLGRALFRKKLKEKAAAADARQNGQWTDFEEVPHEPMDLDIDYEELPPAPPEPLPRTGRKDDTRYDDLFE